MSLFKPCQDLHTHSLWDDGKSAVPDMAAAAAQAGLSSLGVCVHTPMPFGVQACEQRKLPDFLDDMRRAANTAPANLRLYAGAEWDVLSTIPWDPQPDGSVSLASFDYVIGSVHYITVPNPDAEVLVHAGGLHPDLIEQLRFRHFPVDESHQSSKHMVNGYFGGDADEAIRRYYAQYKAVAENPYVQVVGHFDLPMKFCAMYGFLDKEYHVFDENSPAFRSATDDAMQLLTAAGKIFELNTRTLLETVPEAATHRTWEWLSRLGEMGGKVTITSDAHHAIDVAHAFHTAAELLLRSGFTEIYVLEETGTDGRRSPAFVPRKIKEMMK